MAPTFRVYGVEGPNLGRPRPNPGHQGLGGSQCHHAVEAVLDGVPDTSQKLPRARDLAGPGSCRSLDGSDRELDATPSARASAARISRRRCLPSDSW